MMKVIHCLPELLSHTINQDKTADVLTGLGKGRIGFLIAPPGVGKSYLALTLAYELAAMCQYLGLSSNDTPMKTLLWPIEDTVGITSERILAHLNDFPANVKQLIGDNISLYAGTEPICMAGQRTLESTDTQVYQAVNELVESAKEYDLLIIDTLRQAVGSADEVDDDYIIGATLQKIAREADVAILVVHHPTKSVARGNDKVSSVAGSGLSGTLSASKWHLYLDEEINKDTGEAITRLRHIKANYVPADKQLKSPVPMTWGTNSLLLRYPGAIEQNVVVTPTAPKRKTSTPRRRELEPAPDIARDESLLSAESFELSKQPAATGPFSHGMADAIRLAKKK